MARPCFSDGLPWWRVLIEEPQCSLVEEWTRSVCIHVCVFTMWTQTAWRERYLLYTKIWFMLYGKPGYVFSQRRTFAIWKCWIYLLLLSRRTSKRITLYIWPPSFSWKLLSFELYEKWEWWKDVLWARRWKVFTVKLKDWKQTSWARSLLLQNGIPGNA